MGCVIMSNLKLKQSLSISEQQEWLNSWARDSHYCHYFAVNFEGGACYPMGDWNAPFYTLEEAQEFKNVMQVKHPEITLYLIRGALSVEGVLNDTPNKFWETWQKKHKQRIENLSKKLKRGSQ